MGISVLALAVTGISAVSTARFMRSYGDSPDRVSPEAVRSALMERPEIMVEAAQELARRRDRDETAASVALTRGAAKELGEVSERGLGNPVGRHRMVEFLDYQCEYCRATEAQLEKAIREDPELWIATRELAVLGQGSQVAALAALAADRQGKYLAARTSLLALPLPLTDASVQEAMSTLGMDMARFREDMASTDTRDQLASNESLARRVGVTATPTFAAPGAGVMKAFGDMARFKAFASRTDAP